MDISINIKTDAKGNLRNEARKALLLIPATEWTVAGIALERAICEIAFANSFAKARLEFHEARMKMARYCIEVFNIYDREDPVLQGDNDLAKLARALDEDGPIAKALML